MTAKELLAQAKADLAKGEQMLKEKDLAFAKYMLYEGAPTVATHAFLDGLQEKDYDTAFDAMEFLLGSSPSDGGADKFSLLVLDTAGDFLKNRRAKEGRFTSGYGELEQHLYAMRSAANVAVWTPKRLLKNLLLLVFLAVLGVLLWTLPIVGQWAANPDALMAIMLVMVIVAGVTAFVLAEGCGNALLAMFATTMVFGIYIKFVPAEIQLVATGLVLRGGLSVALLFFAVKALRKIRSSLANRRLTIKYRKQDDKKQAKFEAEQAEVVKQCKIMLQIIEELQEKINEEISFTLFDYARFTSKGREEEGETEAFREMRKNELNEALPHVKDYYDDLQSFAQSLSFGCKVTNLE